MHRLLKILSTVVLISISAFVSAQNYFNSPYSRFGIGEMINSGLTYNRSMGGASVALRPRNQINYLNPASYTSQDTLSFLVQFGFVDRIVSLENDKGVKEKAGNSNIEYLTIGFPITRWWKASFGIVPFCRTQYYYKSYEPLNDQNDFFQIVNEGKGGFNEFYFGSSFLLHKDLSLGINAGYIFGNITKRQETIYVNSYIYKLNSAKVSYDEVLTARDFYYKLGVQYTPKINENNALIIGATYDPKIKLNVDHSYKGLNGNYSLVPNRSDSPLLTDTISEDLYGKTIVYPSKIAFGLTHILKNGLVSTIEVQLQNWKDKGSIPNQQKYLANYSSYRGGIEFTPAYFTKHTSKNYFERIKYRVGAYYTNTYLTLNNTQINDYGFSAGLGLPIKRTMANRFADGTTINLSYQYGSSGTKSNGLLASKYHFITIGIVMHDTWFLKPKYD